MSTLRAILELHGSLDTAVIRIRPDPRVAEIANEFLPGTSTNAEWYREIETFIFPPAMPGPRHFRSWRYRTSSRLDQHPAGGRPSPSSRG